MMDPHEIFDEVIKTVEEAANQGLVGYQIAGRVEALRRTMLGDLEEAVADGEEAEQTEVTKLEDFLARLDKASSHAEVNELGTEVGLTLEEKAPKVDEKKAAITEAAKVALAPVAEPEPEA